MRVPTNSAFHAARRSLDQAREFLYDELAELASAPLPKKRDENLLGITSRRDFETGYIFAPFVPLYTTPVVLDADFQARKGLATRYGKKLVNPELYVANTRELKL